MIVDYGGDRETSIVSAPMGAGVRVSVCFSATISVLSSGGTCGRIVEYGGDIETSTASVPTVFFFLFLCNNFCFVWRSYMCKDCGVHLFHIDNHWFESGSYAMICLRIFNFADVYKKYRY
jgi:hypothetical protein